jgi:hypothetical protein
VDIFSNFVDILTVGKSDVCIGTVVPICEDILFVATMYVMAEI